MEQRKHTAAILGGGSFGTATASILAENGHRTRLWVRDPETAAAINEDGETPRYLPGQTLPEGVHATEHLDQVLDGADLIFVAVPKLPPPRIAAVCLRCSIKSPSVRAGGSPKGAS